MSRDRGVEVETARQKAALQRKKRETAESRLTAQELGASNADWYNYEGRVNVQSPEATSGTRNYSTNAIEEPRPSSFKRENDDDESDDIPPRRYSETCYMIQLLTMMQDCQRDEASIKTSVVNLDSIRITQSANKNS